MEIARRILAISKTDYRNTLGPFKDGRTCEVMGETWWRSFSLFDAMQLTIASDSLLPAPNVETGLHLGLKNEATFCRFGTLVIRGRDSVLQTTRVLIGVFGVLSF